MPTIEEGRLRSLTWGALVAVGTPEAGAGPVADSLVDANLAGHDSHGVLRLPQYVGCVRRGEVEPARLPELVGRRGATAIVDGGHGWGQPAMWLATEEAIGLAREFGVAAAVVRRCFHVGRVAPYVEAIARAGMVGLALANAAPAVAPFGGRGRVFGTNPIAWAAPRGEGQEPVCLDVATAAIAEGKLRVARAEGKAVPPDCLLDADGRPTTDPHDFYAGGALRAFGGHKGSGLSLLAQVLGRGLAGLDPTGQTGPRGVNGPVVLALDVAPFVPLEEFVAATEAQCAAVTGSPPAEGVEAVLLPGDPERAARARRLAEGVPVPEAVWAELLAMAAELGIEA